MTILQLLAVTDWFPESFCIRLTLTILHVLWVVAVLATLQSFVLRTLRRGSANVRYTVSCVTLMLMACSVPVIFLLIPAASVSPGSEAVTAAAESAVPTRAPSDGVPGAAPDGVQNPPDNSAPSTDTDIATLEVREPIIPVDVSEQPVLEATPVATPAHSNAPRATTAIESFLQESAPLTSAVYLFGVTLMLCRLVVSLWGSQRLRTTARTVEDESLVELISELARRMGLHNAGSAIKRRSIPLVRWCDRVAVPVVAGILRPVILLPPAVVSGLSPDQLEVLLMHELAHIRRHDLLVGLLQRVIESLLFFHPGVWWVSRRVSFERENCCDDAVVSAGSNPVLYADALIRAAELGREWQSLPTPRWQAVVASSGSGPSEFKRRILRMLGHGDVHLPGISRSGVVALVGIVIATSVLLVAQVGQQGPGYSYGRLAPHPVELASYPGFERFTVTVDGLPLDDDESVRQVESLVVNISESRRTPYNRQFAKLSRDLPKESLEEIEAAADSIINQSRGQHPVWHAALMFNLMMTLHEMEIDATNADANIALRHRFALSALEVADDLPIGLRLRILEYASWNALSRWTIRDKDWPEHRRMLTRLWLSTLQELQSAVDPQWDANDKPALSVVHPGGQYPPGIDPAAISNTEVREAYAALIEANRSKTDRYSQQQKLRTLLTELAPRCDEYLVKFYVRTPIGPDELDAFLNRYAIEPQRHYRVAITVRDINEILGSNRLTGGDRAALSLAGMIGHASGEAAPAVLSLIDSRGVLTFARMAALRGFMQLAQRQNIQEDTAASAVSRIDTMAHNVGEPDELRRLFNTWLPELRKQFPSQETVTDRANAKEHMRSGAYARASQSYHAMRVRRTLTFEDALQRADALHLDGLWSQSRDAYRDALGVLDTELATIDMQLAEYEPPSDGILNEARPQAGPYRYRLKGKRAGLRQQWAQVVQLTGRIELSELNDPQAAIKTLSSGLRFAPDEVTQNLETILQKARTDNGENRRPEFETDGFLNSMYTIATQRYLAMSYERVGEFEAALDCWCRVHLCWKAYRVPLARVDRKHVDRLVQQLPTGSLKPWHVFVRDHPSQFRDAQPQALQLSSSNRVNRTDWPTPFEYRTTTGDGFHFSSHSNNSLVRLPDGRLMMAYVGGDWHQQRIMLTTSRDDRHWETPWELSHNRVFNTLAPALIVDDDGVIWLACISKRHSISASSTGGYSVWLTNSQDGRVWSPLKPERTAKEMSSHHETLHLTRDHRGRFWMFDSTLCGSGDSPDEIELTTPIGFPTEEGMAVTDTFARFDRNGTCHLVFDNFGRELYYTNSADMQTWKTPALIEEKEDGSSVGFGQLLIRDPPGGVPGRRRDDTRQMAVLLRRESGWYMRRFQVTGEDWPPEFGEAICISNGPFNSHGSRLLESSGQVLLHSGSERTPSLLVASINDVLGQSNTASAVEANPASPTQPEPTPKPERSGDAPGEPDKSAAPPIPPEIRQRISKLGGDIRVRGGRTTVRIMYEKSRVTDDDLAALATVPNLDRLEFYADRVSSSGLKHLTGASKLASLELWDGKFVDDDLRVLSQLPLQQLGLYRCTGITDQAVEHFTEMPNLSGLNLFGTSVTGKCLQQLPATQMTALDIRKTGIGPDDLHHLQRFTNLTYICLPHEATDESLQYLSGLTRLKILPLQDTSITGAGLKHLSSLNNLDRLHLIGLAVSDDSLKHLSGLERLSFLNLGFTKISSAGVAHLKTLPALRELQLYDTLVDDDALRMLAEFPKLRRVSLRDTQVTAAGIARLKNARPDLRIEE